MEGFLGDINVAENKNQQMSCTETHLKETEEKQMQVTCVLIALFL